MARILKDGVIGNLSGKVGQVIVKHYRNKTVVTSLPICRQPRSPKQKAQNNRFKEAMEYARLATRKSPTMELYQVEAERDQKAANTVAVSDYLRPPRIKEVELKDYHGRPGSPSRSGSATRSPWPGSR